jgi:hypothetical protein
LCPISPYRGTKKDAENQQGGGKFPHPKTQEVIIMEMDPKEIKTHPIFKSLFPVNPELVAKIEADMKAEKYDLSQPVILATWNGQDEIVCLDGHTRIQAAINAGIESIPVFFHKCNDEQKALKKAIRLQSNRRNMTDAEIVRCVDALDTLKPRGGDRRSDEVKSKASSDAIEKPSSKSAQDTADLLGISASKVERLRSVLKHGDADMLEAVKNGELSINTACNETRNKRKNSKSTVEDTASQAANCADASADLAPMSPDEALNLAEEREQETETDEDSCCSLTDDATVTLAWEHYRALKELGGSIQDHVDMAIDLYLSMCLRMIAAGQVETDDDA